MAPGDTRAGSALARWRRSRERLVVLALTATLALLTGPVRSALRVGCDLCPPDCPMHDTAQREKAEHGHDDQRPKMRCHNTPGAAAHDDTTADAAKQARFSKPSCGSHVALSGLDTTPMLPGGPPSWRVAEARGAVDAGRDARLGRDRDPPDTPPPVLRA
jgi:hypothetical protein